MSQISRKVMFIDDDKHFLYLIERIVKKIESISDFLTALNGQDALDQIDQMLSSDSVPALPTILFTDINMPIMDGFAFIEQFKQRQTEEPRLDAVQVIVVLSSSADQIDKTRFADQGIATEYLIKQSAPQMKSEIERILIDYSL